MVKNVSGGNKSKGQSRNIKKAVEYDTLDDGQLFGIVQKNMGGAFSVLCSDGVVRRGKATNKVKNARDKRLIEGTCIIVSLREFEKDNKNCDIINFAPSYVIGAHPLLQVKKETNNTLIDFTNETITHEDLKPSEDEVDITDL